VAAASFAQSGADQAANLQQITQTRQNALAQYNLKQIL
jgi:hypothetical protein